MVANKLDLFREALRLLKLDAFIVPMCDPHFSEYVAKKYARVEYISEFKGSAGTAVITLNEAALWTDGRYWLQAGKQLGSAWTLMKDGDSGTPSKENWLSQVLKAGATVGVDPYLVTSASLKNLTSALETKSQHVNVLEPGVNPVDMVWERDASSPRPTLPSISKVFKHLEIFSGKTTQDKVRLIRSILRSPTNKAKTVCDALVVTELDDVAWIMNLRGSDVPHNPVFYGYCVVTMDHIYLFADADKIGSKEVQQHLAESDVNALPYEDVCVFLKDLVSKSASNTNINIWTSKSCSVALTGVMEGVDGVNIVSEISPIECEKAKKNHVEMECMKTCHIRDSAALCIYFHWLEDQIANKKVKNMSETDASDCLEQIRSEMENFVSLSFTTISSMGSNGAIIHYSAERGNCALITDESLYLCDSGAQYLDGTTDVTRTMHFGTPSAYQKDCFTRVLKGQIALDKAVFPVGTFGQSLDVLARQHLWGIGLDFKHGTSHGVGMFLNCHEGPICVRMLHPTTNRLYGFQENMVISNEPGYYEDGQFGIRLENCIYTKKAQTKHNFANTGFLEFDTLTMVPIQKKLIDASIMTDAELLYLNKYHQRVYDNVSPILENLGKTETLGWLKEQTSPIHH